MTQKINFTGMLFTDFEQLIGERFHARRANLIPSHKFGSEMALTSIFLAAMKMVREFGITISDNIGLATVSSVTNLHVYAEIEFPEFDNKRIDGMLCLVRGKKIIDMAFLEMKNGTDTLCEDQILDYITIAEAFSVPRIITVSNQFVATPTQSPLDLPKKRTKNVLLSHISWSFIITVAKLLLADNDTNIEDPDQVAIMTEVVNYFTREKSGVADFSRMKPGWKNICERINKQENIKASDADLTEAVESWLQEEKDMALKLSQELGVMVGTGIRKYREDLTGRIKQEKDSLRNSSTLTSTLKVVNAASDIVVRANFIHRSLEFITELRAPGEAKTLKGQIGWIRRTQFNRIEKKTPELYEQLKKDLMFTAVFRGSRVEESKPLDRINDLTLEYPETKLLKSYGIVLRYDMGKDFGHPTKSIAELERLLVGYYGAIVQHLQPWIPPAPSVKKKETAEESEPSPTASAIEEKQTPSR